jgi:hypothetical protein
MGSPGRINQPASPTIARSMPKVFRARFVEAIIDYFSYDL